MAAYYIPPGHVEAHSVMWESIAQSAKASGALKVLFLSQRLWAQISVRLKLRMGNPSSVNDLQSEELKKTPKNIFTITKISFVLGENSEQNAISFTSDAKCFLRGSAVKTYFAVLIVFRDCQLFYNQIPRSVHEKQVSSR